jgi:aspartate racemase
VKTIGLIGGMSWESSQVYYQSLNQHVKRKLGGLHSAKVILYSVDFAEIEKLQHQGDWGQTAEILAKAASSLEKAGAECVLICTNTMHKVAEMVQNAVKIPLIHIAEATANSISEQGLKSTLLLGTRFTMEEDFYKDALVQNGLDVFIPELADREAIHRVIYDELCLGKVLQDSQQAFLDIIKRFQIRGVQSVILGCTEIGLLVTQDKVSIPVFDTTHIHVEAAIKFALQ